MTDDQLREWKRLADAATSWPSPWAVTDQGNGVYAIETDNECLAEVFGEPDAAFIAAAREAVPALIAEVERLRGALFGIAERDCCPDTMGGCGCCWLDKHDAAEALKR